MFSSDKQVYSDTLTHKHTPDTCIITITFCPGLHIAADPRRSPQAVGGGPEGGQAGGREEEQGGESPEGAGTEASGGAAQDRGGGEERPEREPEPEEPHQAAEPRAGGAPPQAPMDR